MTSAPRIGSHATPRRFDAEAFDRAYEERIIGNRFFEAPDYYQQQRPRYRTTIEHLTRLALPESARVLEIGGGQIALLSSSLFGDECVVADVSPRYADAVTNFGIGFVECDLLHDDLDYRDHFDLMVLCEVIEHMPVPPHIVLEKMRRWLKPGGYLFLTTPNLYRLRNLVRLALGMKVFGTYFYPERGHSIGHPVEYSADHMRWQLERAGYEEISITLEQLVNRGATPMTSVARMLLRPLQLRPLWRDAVVAISRRPGRGSGAAEAGALSGTRPAVALEPPG